MTSPTDPHDPYLWLEEIEGEAALEWVRAHNAQTLDRYESTPLFQDLYRTALAILDSPDKLVYPSRLGDTVYNFWRDEAHPRGLLRRTSQAEFLTGQPHWETLLDLDALAQEENENWVYQGHTPLPPDYRRTLLWLSRGGSDASVVREFDLEHKRFVTPGFQLPEAKSDLAWRDADSLYVGTDFGPGSLTESGYPRQMKLWSRGTELDRAELLFEAQPSDLAVSIWTVRDPEESIDLLIRSTDFWNDQKYLIQDREVRPLPLPSDASLQTYKDGQLILLLRSAWSLDTALWPAGSLVGVELSSLTGQGPPRVHAVFQPQDGETVESVATTSDGLLLTISHQVSSQVHRRCFGADGWRGQRLAWGQETQLSVVSCSRRHPDAFVTAEDFLVPPTLTYLPTEGPPQAVQSLPERFPGEGLVREQCWATSADGTPVPYFMVRPESLPWDGSTPTVLYGYGGFEVSLLPAYLTLAGPSWLARGGVYVQANIRGGGEFGPAWHQAALRENRHKAFEDFEAVAEDLIRRGVCSPATLGIHGRSNGGLLTGAMLTRRPELFGAVLIGVPLLDMRRYHRLLAGASWMAEYGDPDRPEDWAFLRTYSPYHNLRADRSYPVPLIFTSTKDDRVHPAHARKMTAKMESMGLGVISFENLEGGHAGASNNQQTAFFTALNYTYLADRLGLASRDRSPTDRSPDDTDDRGKEV